MATPMSTGCYLDKDESGQSIDKKQYRGMIVMQAPLELVGLGFSSSMDSFASWKTNGSRMEKGRERGDATSRRRLV